MMILSTEIKSLMRFNARLPIGSRRFIMDLGDDGYVAEWLGWTNIDCPDGIMLRGCPPEKWLKPGVRWSRSKVEKVRRNGNTAFVPSYCHDAREWYWVEREIEERGLSGEYSKTLYKVMSMTNLDPTICPDCNSYHKIGTQNAQVEQTVWNASTLGTTDRAAALLITLGYKIMTYDEMDRRHWNFEFEVLERPEPIIELV